MENLYLRYSCSYADNQTRRKESGGRGGQRGDWGEWGQGGGGRVSGTKPGL